MNIKKILASVVAAALTLSSFVAISSVSAAGATMTGTLVTDDDMFNEDYGFFMAATAGSGVKISFEDLDKNIDYVDFELKIPADLKVEENIGTNKKPNYVLSDLTVDSIAECALVSDVTWTIYERESTDADYKVFYFQFINNTAEGWDGTGTELYFASSLDDGATYDVKTGAFDITNVKFGYVGDVDYTDITVVQATTAATPEPTATPDPAAATVSELQESDAETKNGAGYDFAKAIYKQFSGAALAGKKVAWTIGDKTAAFDYAVADIDADVVVGLVITAKTADELAGITAATAAIVD